jgi:hypothetical protein
MKTQKKGSWLLWFYNDKMADHEHKDILGQAPEGDVGTVFSENHIVVGSVGVKKGPRTHQRFGLKPRDLPALIFIHKGTYFLHPKQVVLSSSDVNPSNERFRFSWDSIIQFALHIQGGHQPTQKEEGEEGDGEEDSSRTGDENGQAAASGSVAADDELSSSATMFANVQAQDIPKPANDWDDFMAMVHIMFKECPTYPLFIVLGLVLMAAFTKTKKQGPKQEVATTKKKS